VIALVALIWPAASPADHTRTIATVSAKVTAQRSTDVWVVELRWTATCLNVADGKDTVFEGDLFLVDEETGERTSAGGVVSSGPSRSFSGSRETFVAAIARPQRLRPELTIGCYETFPQDGGPDTTVNGEPVLIPRRFGGSSGGGGGSGGSGGGGGGPGEPVGRDGCLTALLGTNSPDTLTGGGEDEIIVGFAARDRIKGRAGSDCLIGGTGGDRLEGEDGSDRLTGGSGSDVLIDTKGFNAFDAGAGNDYVNARNGRRELVRCGSGRDRARVDRRDRLRSCERIDPRR
jgi:hypothetical protein